MKVNKLKKFYLSFLLVVASFVCLVFSTVAWYTFSKRSSVAVGTVTAGSPIVNVALYEYDGSLESNKWNNIPSKQIIINNMFPGDSKFFAIQVTNTGNMSGHSALELSKEIESAHFEYDGEIISAVKDENDAPYHVSKMMELYVDIDSTTSTLSDTVIPTNHIAESVETSENQTQATQNSLYTLTDALSEDYVKEDENLLGEDESQFYFLQFYFSSAAGNDYGSAQLKLSNITMTIQAQ